MPKDGPVISPFDIQSQFIGNFVQFLDIKASSYKTLVLSTAGQSVNSVAVNHGGDSFKKNNDNLIM